MGCKLCRCTPIGNNDIVERSTLCHLDARSRYSHRSIDQDYDVHHSTVLGTGFSGPVILAINKHTGQQSAVKMFDKQDINKKKMDFLRAEVNIYLQVDHPHIARLLHVYEEEDNLSLVMELCTGRELFHRLAQKKVFGEQEAATATYQMCLAISYLHRHHIVHRDLKLENWLYENDSETAKLKLIDFGFSKLCAEQSEMMQQSCGSIAYVAPEVLTKQYTNKCDMWSLGVIVFMLLGGYPPFGSKDQSELVKKIKLCDYSFRRDKWDHTTEYARDFITKLLVHDPADRMSAMGALEHPWLTKIDQEAHVNWEHNAQSSVSANLLEDLRRYAKGSHFKHLALSIMAHHLSSSELEEIREAFLALDVDKNGAITFKELREAMMKSQFSVSEEELQGIFEVINVTHDKEIHYSEFIAAVMQTRIHMDKNLLRETFDYLDVFRAGKITKKDLRKVIGGNKFEDTDISSLMSECQGCTSKSGITFEQFSEHLQSIDSLPTTCSSNWSLNSHGSPGQLEHSASFRSRESTASSIDQTWFSERSTPKGNSQWPSTPKGPPRPQEDGFVSLITTKPCSPLLEEIKAEFDFSCSSATFDLEAVHSTHLVEL